ncbi:hypothetical protein KL931_005132 [Ogataea haglerorum]|uniref:Spindle pole body component Bbp1 C-terminal domain-containing protein n=1 Tax=Ogataea haglerorum TaxID=1937702 RepID=A0ABQ7R9F8_9ASCO|nr:hypothetical protein KL946_005239 [Ogataea haglerorum]KAG7763011.1 hypothetical protein KL931_005132 [Ogataea haglerorum]KAG7804913.1 hypothetical protein KL924_005236 [Ogataea haglerorum]
MFDTTTVQRRGLFGKVYNSIFGPSPSPLNTQTPIEDHDPVTEYNTSLNSEGRYLSRDDDLAIDDELDDTRSRRSSEIAPPMTPSRLDDDWKINDTLERIRMSRERWQRNDHVPGEFPEPAPEHVQGGLAEHIERNNQIISKLMSDFDLLAENVELQQLRTENAELAQKYKALREEFKRELDTNKEIFDGYYDLYTKYNKIKTELSKLKKDASDRIGDLELENQRLKVEARSRRVTSDDQNLYYKSQYEEIKKELQKKIQDEKASQQRIRDLELQLHERSLAKARGVSSNTLDQDSIQLLHKLYADKEVPNTSIDSWISKPRIKHAI